MRHFYLVWNPYKEGTRSMAEEIREWLRRRGCVCGMQTNGGARPAEGRYKYTDSSQVPEDTECVLTLGGDGTLIQAARDLAGRQIPMLGVNMGNLGYLTQVSRREELEEVLQALLKDRFRLERRMMLKGSVIRDGQEIARYALQEDRTVTIGEADYNVLEIRDGQAAVIDANCGDHTCVRTGAVSRAGESIICLPHRLEIRITGGADSDVDIVAQ